jgi:hypothetical protein
MVQRSRLIEAENARRKDFEPDEIYAITQALEPIEKAAAKERKVANLKRGDKKPVVESFHNGGKTRDKVGAFAGVSGRQVEKIVAVNKAAEQQPEKFAAVRSLSARHRRSDRAPRRAEGRTPFVAFSRPP